MKIEIFNLMKRPPEGGRMGESMIVRKIRLRDTEDVKEFVASAENCDFEIDVYYNRAVIDAKSLLGMLYLGVCKELTIKYGGKNESFENTVNKYAVA